MVLNTDMHSSAAQTGNSLVLIKHLAAQTLPSEITKSILDLNYLEDDTVWHFFFWVCKLVWILKDISNMIFCS